MNRTWAVAAIAALVVAFAGGFLLAKGVDGAFASSASGAQATQNGELWGLFGQPRAADALRRGNPEPEGFAVWKTRLDTSGAQPLACVVLTRPLDPTRSYSDFVLVSPDLGHPPAVSVKDTQLCIGGAGFGDRRITLLRGLPDKAGDTLAGNADVDFSAVDKPPYVGFAGQGVILPRDESDGVGIETINVTKLAIEVWRVPDRNLVRKEISAPSPTSEGDYADDYGDDSPDDEGRVVWKGFIAVKGDPGAKTTTVFPLGAVLKEMTPGGYVVKARDASGGRDLAAKSGDDSHPAQARRWVMFTDMALIAYSGADSLDVVVRSLKSARTLSGLSIALVAKDGETLANVRSDSSGKVSFAHALLAGEGAAAPKMVMAYGPQGDLAVLDLDRSPVDLSKLGTGGRATSAAPEDATGGRTAKTAVDGYVYADRGIYRPGERVHLTALVRDRDAKTVEDHKGYLLVKRPSGVEFKRYLFADAAGGAVLADVDLPRSAPRGKWTAELRMDGYDDPAGALSFSVEDFVPQRLAVTVQGRSEVPVTSGEMRSIDVAARFLYGALAAGLQTQGEARVRTDPNPFPQFADYQWGDEVKPFDEKFVELGSTVTDGAGRASLALAAAAAGDSSDPLDAAVTASVFEPGGRPVREAVNLKIRDRPVYLGVKVEEGRPTGDRSPLVSLDVIAVDAGGRRAAATTTYVLVSENWSYDWFQQDGKWQWRRSSRDVVAARGVLAIGAAVPARLTRRLGWGDYRLEIEAPGGARTVKRFSSGWGGSSEDVEAPDQVRVSAGERSRAQGDTVEVAIKAPYAGEAQVAVATDHLIDFKTLTLGAGGGVVRLKTSAAWGGGAYVLVTVVQPRDPVATPLPRRALGLVYVPLDPGGRRLLVQIGAPAKVDSRAPIVVPLAVKGLGFGQSAYVTVAAVDQGVLALTKFESPDPLKWYFGKRALTVDYRDDYGRLLDPNLGAPANVDFGGDELGGEGLTVTPTKTVALWSGVVKTGADGRATVRLPAGEFNGEVRIMAVAWTDKAVGAASVPMTVREPVVADLDLPRFLSPGDKPLATLELHNLEGAPGDYTARGFGMGGVVMAFKQVFHLLLGERSAQHIPFLAPNRTGLGKVGFQVVGPAFAAAKTYDIETRLGWGPVTRATTDAQAAGETYVPPPSLLAGLAAGDVEMQVSYSPFRDFDPATIALALSRYPYGCTEQLVSVAYPLLYASDVSTDPRVRRGMADAVGKLIDRQSLDGAFGLWRVGDGEADPWLGAYATDFLIEAQAEGAPIPPEVVDKALGAMRQVSRADSSPSVAYRLDYPDWWAGGKDESKALTQRMRQRASAYALYVLAKAGRGDLPRLRWWHDVQMKEEASPLAVAQIGAALAFMGDRARGRSALRRAVDELGYSDQQDSYQTPLRDLAGVIALAYEAGEPQIARGLQGRLAGAVKDPDRLNTQEEARLLQAAHYMLKDAGALRIDAAGATPLAAIGGAPRWAVGRLAVARFVNRGSGPVWRTVTVRGTPLVSPAIESSGLDVAKNFYSMSGSAVNLAGVKQGDRVIIRVSGKSTLGRTMAMAVNDALPAGFEIETTLSPEDAKKGPFKFLGELTDADAQESRDDRYVAALSLGGGKAFAFAYIARAVTPGTFFLPGAEAVDMYHKSISGRTAASRLEVLPAG